MFLPFQNRIFVTFILSSKNLSYGKELTILSDKILDWSILKTFANDKINSGFVFGRVENSVGKGENAGYYNVFKTLFESGLFQKCLDY